VAPGSAEDPLNFVDLVVKWLHRWASTFGAATDLQSPAYCCFILCDRVLSIAEALSEFQARPLFRDDTPPDALGRLYLCSGTLQTVFAKAFIGANMDDVVREVEDLSLGGSTIVIFNSATKRALWRDQNQNDFTAIEVGGKFNKRLRPKDFDKELDRFHLKYTSNPQGWALPWKDGKSLQTKDNLEVEIRNWLCVVLRLQYEGSLSVSMEHQEPTGRADLKVFFIAERIPYFLELKVFRKVRPVKGRLVSVSKNDTIKWGKDGVAQAYSYLLANDEIGVAYVCCYDARGKDEEVLEVKAYAQKMKIQYRRFYMFPSANALHKALIT
jgi:hypothetical protein